MRGYRAFVSVLFGATAALISSEPGGSQPSYEVLHAFRMPGWHAVGPLLQASDGNFYGTTLEGGDLTLYNGAGTLFRIDSTGTLTTLHSFDCGIAFHNAVGCYPSALIQGSDGFLYGVTQAGGVAGGGSIFRADTTGTLTTLHSFDCMTDESCHPNAALVQGADGFLYGSAGNVMFKMDTGGGFTSLHSPACTGPSCGLPSPLIQASDGFFYGTTCGGEQGGFVRDGGAVFRMDAAGTVTPLHSFACSSTEGCLPGGGLIQATDGFLYGVTKRGGAADKGTVFKMSVAGAITTLHSFLCNAAEGCRPDNGLVQASDGFFYGSTQGSVPGGGGTIFRMDASGAFSTLFPSFDCNGPAGCSPGGLIQAGDGRFYGTTTGGGAGGLGTVFKITAAGSLTTLKAFGSTPEGWLPHAGLVQAADGKFYGTTAGGGLKGFGTVFSIDRTGVTTTLHSFDCATEGCRPQAGLILGAGGDLYGTTSVGGGPANGGTLFKVTTAGVVTVLDAFDCASCHPETEVFQAGDGNLYGTTRFAGATSQGTVFRTTLAGNSTILRSLDCNVDGCEPIASLMQGGDGALYGTTWRGVPPGDGGTVFRIDTAGTLTRLHVFSCTSADGCNPYTRLLQASDGFFYGTTDYNAGFGTLFRMDSAGAVTTLHSFDCAAAEGCTPNGSLIQAGDGSIYGTTELGGALEGTVYRMNGAGVVSVVHPFDCRAEGCHPFRGHLLQADDGLLYGAAQSGPGGGGVVFRIGGASPGEASQDGDMLLSAAGGTLLKVTYTPACGATNHAVYWGKSPIVGAPEWTHVACAPGSSGEAVIDPGNPPVGTFFYFVAVGQSASSEGSYGHDSIGSELPEAQGLGACDQPQVLTGTCL